MMELSLLDLVFLLLPILIILLIIFYKRNYDFDYWKRKGIPFIKPFPLVGNFYEAVSARMTMGHLLEKFYKQMKTPYFGLYAFNQPLLILRNPDMIKNILVKDFDYFSDHNILCDATLDPLVSKMLFVIKNPEWKAVHARFSPLFTPAKLKSMSHLIKESSDKLILYLGRQCEANSLDAKELSTKYATEAITSCAFGIDAQCFESDDAEFYEISKKIFSFSWKSAIAQMSYFLAHRVALFFKFPFLNPECTNFMRKVFWETMQEREGKNYQRNDLIDIIIEIKNENKGTNDITLEQDVLLAQAGNYFVGGSDTTSTTMGFTLYELCLHPEIQNKLRLEIQRVVSEQGGFTYSSVQEIKYLHMVILEALRKYSSPPFLDRICVKDYRLPNTDITIDKGTPVLVPLLGLHYDAEFFPEPDKYDPERFSDENKEIISNFRYLPFGGGPRGCIGQRFALLSLKMGIARIISEFELVPCDRTPNRIIFDTKAFLLSSNVGLPMKFKRIKTIR